jgi:hypothetical protein
MTYLCMVSGLRMDGDLLLGLKVSSWHGFRSRDSFTFTFYGMCLYSILFTSV